jgi:hypothetical protein
MCLRRAPEKYITGAMSPVGAALHRAVIQYRLVEGYKYSDLILRVHNEDGGTIFTRNVGIYL